MTDSEKLDRIIELLEALLESTNYATEQAQLATHRPGCKCGSC